MSAAGSGDPHFRFVPYGPDFDRDPYPTLARLREDSPVYWWEEAGAWVLTRYADVVEVLGDEERFSPDLRRWEHYEPPPREHESHPVIRMRDSNLLFYEGAEHTRLRRLASVAMTRRAVRVLEPLMRQLIDELLDAVAPRGSCDFVGEIASIYPATVVSRMLGIPPNSERERGFKTLADVSIVAFNPMVEEGDALRAIQAMDSQMAMVRRLMEEKRAEPGDDLMTDMIQAEAEGDRFTPDEVLSLVMAILVAGSETTANSMGFGLLELLRRPDQLARFRDDPSVRPDAVHEILRHQMPGRFLNRYPKMDTEVGGRTLRKGQLVLCSIAAAQRDPDYVDDPDRFDIAREPRDSTAFGIGRHFCLGAQLARLELETSLGRVVERLPNLELAVDEAALEYRSNPAVRGLAALPLRFDAG